jgi:hypothetical protein
LPLPLPPPSSPQPTITPRPKRTIAAKIFFIFHLDFELVRIRRNLSAVTS